jgi:RNA polymerase sigma-B factor
VTDRDHERELLFEEYARIGSVEVRNRLVESHAPLAEYFARRYRRPGNEEDVRQVAHLALVKAVDRFDPEVGVRFSTFAGRTIDGELKRHFRDRGWAVRVPRRLQEASLELRNLGEELTATHGRAPTIDELAEASGYDVDEVLEALDVQSASRATSIDRPSGAGDGSLTLAATLGSADRRFDRAEAALAVEALLDTLPERERRILELRFFGEMSQQQIADEIGISQMHVSRLLRRSLEALRSHLE